MKVATGVEMITLEAEAFGGKIAIHPTLLWNEQMAVLVDTGMPGSWELIRAAMIEAGVSPEKLKAVIITHQDIDHIGSLPEIVRALDGQIEVYAHELDQPYIEGKLPLFKTNPERMAAMLASLPEEERQKLQAVFANSPKAKVDKIVADGEVLPILGGIRVIHTPGHTPGHISLYLQDSKTLIAGDAMVYTGGALRGPVPQSTLDMETALQSLKKLQDTNIQAVICYHGGLCEDNAEEQLQALIQA
ncbi:hydrolase [Brevibacillus reuszeri]|uniref:Hydrolase n=1 Tax=Brevibacillus reuszeri TaxID=54915 RepID=A0A0K9YTT1_9BACL|nr:MBL fold metallo-hydrolase [Brevibacillus reuszeri]KNB71605.1 hydrolase [Brevibacillus reuszeri]MED1855577.1 MBL fold metallo-hydrolase [Brevibacillus reuszeri]GED67271.1 hydrolase [Brevibacillus reuszeri]